MFWALFLPFALFSWSSHLAPFPLLEAIKHYCVLQICLSQLPVKDAQDIRKLYPELYSCQHNLGRKWAKPRWMQKSLPGPYSSQSKIDLLGLEMLHNLPPPSSVERHRHTIHLNQQLSLHPSACLVLLRRPSATANGIYLINKDGGWRIKPSLKEETVQCQIFISFKNSL